MTLILIAATLCAGLFAGAAIYINLVEHPARLSCGTELAVREFAPSYRRATLMQVPLALSCFVTGLWSAWERDDPWIALAAVLVVAAIPFTLLVIMPTNTRLMDTALDSRSDQARKLLVQWGRLHAVRTILSLAGFVILAFRLAR